MDIVQQLQRGIQTVSLSPAVIARADAAILRRHGREVERAHEIVSSYAMWKPARAALPQQRLDAIRLTREYDCIASDGVARIEAAILATTSYEAAAQLIEQAVE